jgi:Na+/melibiose symporter-like transporter
MSTDETDSLQLSLCSLATTQLKIQGTISRSLDFRLHCVLVIDAMAAAIILGTGHTHGVWIAAVVLLVVSVALAAWTLRLPAERTGPSPHEILQAGETLENHILGQSLLDDLSKDIVTNEHSLLRKTSMSNRALIFLMLGFLVEIAARLQ